MKFEWDENKRRANIENHGIDFVGVSELFESETYSVIDERFDYGETRYYTTGFLNGEVLAVSHTEEDEVIRLISVRKANKNEEETYFRKVRN
jgi:uncharacterized DUF497 family protein